jgi:hypothetical protein
VKWKGWAVGTTVVVVGFLLRGPWDGGKPRLPGGRPIRVEVLNGSGVAKAGWGLAEELRELGFDVVSIGNADRSDYEETLVLDRVGNPDYALAVAEELETEPAFRQRNDDLLLEVTVILGRDRAERYCRGPGGGDR